MKCGAVSADLMIGEVIRLLRIRHHIRRLPMRLPEAKLQILIWECCRALGRPKQRHTMLRGWTLVLWELEKGALSNRTVQLRVGSSRRAADI